MTSSARTCASAASPTDIIGGVESPPPLLIALTGGIASGKSAVASIFASLGVPVLDTDQIARDVVEPGSPTLNELIRVFGKEILGHGGRLDRAHMRQRVFNDPAQREQLEAIMHPAIREELARQSQAAGGEYQVHVIPLLVETGRSRVYDRVLVVDSSEEEQIKRLMARDSTDREHAARILAAQASRDERLAAADDVIVNMGSVEELPRFVQTLHKNYSLLARKLRESNE
jgi:dephospho-CoA kinase